MCNYVDEINPLNNHQSKEEQEKTALARNLDSIYYRGYGLVFCVKLLKSYFLSTFLKINFLFLSNALCSSKPNPIQETTCPTKIKSISSGMPKGTA